jgi:hypothetical protein
VETAPLELHNVGAVQQNAPVTKGLAGVIRHKDHDPQSQTFNLA